MDSELGFKRAWKNILIFPKKERFWCQLYIPNVLDENEVHKLTDYFDFYNLSNSRYERMSRYTGQPRIVGKFN